MIDYLNINRRPQWTDTNIEYHRAKSDTGFVVDSSYLKRYYSVIDAEIFFGNEYVEDIADIHWQIITNTMIIHGYNSYTYDAAMQGARYIQGNFTINFTNPHYLFSILKAADNSNKNTITTMTSYDVPALGADNKPTLRPDEQPERIQGKHAQLWPETFDIDIILGEKTGIGDPVHIMLTNVVLTGNEMILSSFGGDRGAPPALMEQYTFIGQDIKTVVSSIQ